LQFTIYINEAYTGLENISCQPVKHGKRECIRVFLIYTLHYIMNEECLMDFTNNLHGIYDT